MTSEVFTINPENTLHEAAQLMGEKHIGSLIVMKYETPVGIITEGDLLSVVTNGIPLERDWIRSSPSICNEKVEKVMSYPVIKICVEYRLKDAARLMIEKRVRRLGVCDSGSLVGILTTSDMIGSLPQVPETMKAWFEVDHFMSKQVVTTDEGTLLEDAAKIMAERNVGSVIVTSKGEPTGIFTERDLLTKFLAKDKSLVEEVGNVCSSPLITAPIGISAHAAAEIMIEKHIKRLPITRGDKLVGVLSARDLVEAYARG
ncbi:MAG: CBS domain-containing protein [Candidatus Bathyarchaeia archaeon]|nr:CBS domain-containing protein [Candidatus Bathyarchaeia archaeon]